MTAFPPRDQLARVTASLARQLPERYPAILADDRFAEVRAALTRLAEPAAPAAAVAGLSAAEAERLAEEMLRRWAVLGAVDLDPAAAIVGPDRVRVGETATYEVVADGVEDGWTVAWTGPARPAGAGSGADPAAGAGSVADPQDRAGGGVVGGRTAVLGGTAPGPIRLGARVFARAGGRRRVLVAHRTVVVVDSGAPP
jgi:hypothetical protein